MARPPGSAEGVYHVGGVVLVQSSKREPVVVQLKVMAAREYGEFWRVKYFSANEE